MPALHASIGLAKKSIFQYRSVCKGSTSLSSCVTLEDSTLILQQPGGRSMSYSGGASSTSADDEAVISQLQSELQVAYVQEFYQTVRDKCFEKCVTKPSSSLGSSEQQCIARCADRYSENTLSLARPAFEQATQVVAKSLLETNGLQ